jgi:predicted TIM-barrel fold metal-dependent hydrolase
VLVSIAVPRGAVDCHVHIVGQATQFPQAPNRHYTCAEASLAMLRAAAAPEVQRFVVVQPSFYGTDNEATLQACDALNGRSRAVAVVDPAQIDDDQARRLKARGVAGLRLNLNTRLQGDHRQLAAVLPAHAALAQRMGWHLQFHLPFAALLGAARLIEELPVPVVLDHFGLPLGRSPDSGEGRALRDLAAQQNVWVKLSAPYRLGLGDHVTATPRDWLAAMLEAAPDRCLWGSDWPHTPPSSQQQGPASTPANRPLSYAELIGDFIAALGSVELAGRILVRNPERLYGFAPA